MQMNRSKLEQATGWHQQGRHAEAEMAYRDCLAAGDARAALPLAVLLQQGGRHAEALALLEPLAAANPGHAGLAANLSVALRHAGRHGEALRFAQQAVRLAPREAAAWNALGLAALETDEASEALAAFEAGLRLAPGHPAFVLHRAHALARLGRGEEALAGYRAVLDAAPDLVDAWRGLARLQARLGDAAGALASRERALALAPDDPEVQLEHAAALLPGDAAAAAARLREFLAAHPGDAQAWTWLGRAELRRGDAAAAREAFERAVALDPGDAVAAHYRAALAGTLPEAVEAEYVRGLFDDFADRFDATLVGRLAYRTPGLLAAFLAEEGGVAREVLDLGCGTGLMAAELAAPDRAIDGVDLSSRMLAQARAKGLYRSLHEAELGAFLASAEQQWDWIVAADVFVYMAELGPVLAAMRLRLRPGGCLAFSIEASSGARVELPAATGRYRHDPQAVAAALVEAGFRDIRQREVELRREMGEAVAGVLFLAARG